MTVRRVSQHPAGTEGKKATREDMDAGEGLEGTVKSEGGEP